ncbi:uncharacterized protein LOC121049287 [Rosa chinensis]|uniref:uncharacterized protein LOC121049287 n=1 Tax=Rosa chinensis TaxID=74649 RepID=UPI001AD8E7DF|nr:uncharacterized protein LOC121049287 [Rosa chinensis]
MLEMIAFIDPDHTGALACGNPTERARSLAVRYGNGKPGQVFLVPYNSGCHWMLTVVNPGEEVVHFMDPLKRRLITGEWKTIVDDSIRIYNAQKNRKGRKIVQWKNCAGIPEQLGDKTCGLWIMHYMKDIAEDKNQHWSAKAPPAKLHDPRPGELEEIIIATERKEGTVRVLRVMPNQQPICPWRFLNSGDAECLGHMHL